VHVVWPHDGLLVIYVYRLPKKLSDGYAFGGGKPIGFLNVDWFEGDGYPGQDGPATRQQLTEFIRGKRYFNGKARFLVLGPIPDQVFVIEPADNDT
jgi:hypothetical protein